MTRKARGVLFGGILLGIVVGLIVAAKLDWTPHGLADQRGTATLTVVPAQASLPTADQRALADAVNSLYVGIVERVSPAVVTIISESKVMRRNPFADLFNDPFFRRFFDFPQPEEELGQVLGSGVVVRSDGYVLTNHHVIADAVKVRVTLGKDQYKAKIVGSDPKTDIAVLKIEDSRQFAIVPFGDSDKLRIGEEVLAFGTPFSPKLERSVSRGIVSAKGRADLPIQGSEIRYFNFIQTDAAINPGNSGGPLVNLYGELVGINTAIVGQANVGIGFAIPANTAKWVMEQLIEKGQVTRGWLGVLIQDVTAPMAKALKMDSPRGVVVSEVVKDSPAEKAGLKASDVILEIDGVPAENKDQVSARIASTPPGTKVTLTVLRRGSTRRIEVTLGTLPEEETTTPRIAEKSSTKLGFAVQNLTNELAARYGYQGQEGVLVTDVERGSVAASAGLQPGQLIKEVNQVPVRTVRDLEQELDKLGPGDPLLLRVYYQKRNLFIAMQIPEE
ncbi:MAG: Do family serine endopeptidase [candidate division KSB1 bacterium]|nr:Do family serine endopeptidase [candidate division KSB1 bacterium]